MEKRLDFVNKQGCKHDGAAHISVSGPGEYSDGTPHGVEITLSLHGESNQSYRQGRSGGVQALSPVEARSLALALLEAAEEAECLALTGEPLP